MTAQATPEVLPAEYHHEPTTAALALRHEEAGSLVLPSAPLDQIVEAFQAYQAMCDRLLVPEDYQRIGNKQFRKKSAWRKLATAFGVSTERRTKEYERNDRGRIIRAEVEMRAIAPNGRYMDGLGACDAFERCCDPATCTNTYSKHQHCPPDCNGLVHFSKPSHDIPATAMTRATNRACADLFGFGEVSAEEMDPNAAEHPAPGRQNTEEQWFRENGWADGRVAHDAYNAESLAIHKSLSDAQRNRYREWAVAEGLPFGQAKTRTEAEAMRAKLVELRDEKPEQVVAPEDGQKVDVEQPPDPGRPFTAEDLTPVPAPDDLNPEF